MKRALVVLAALGSLGATGAAFDVPAELMNAGGLLAFAGVTYRQGERIIARFDELIAAGATSAGPPPRRRRRKPAAAAPRRAR